MVRNLKILKGVIYAEVEVAGLDNGGWVTMNVKLGRGESADASAALDGLCEAVQKVAEQHMAQASDNRLIQKRVDERVKQERKRHGDALEIQRRSFVERLRQKAAWLTSGDARRTLEEFADRLDQEKAS